MAKRADVRSSFATDESERMPPNQCSLSRLRKYPICIIYKKKTIISTLHIYIFPNDDAHYEMLKIYNSVCTNVSVLQFVISPKSLDKEIKLQIPIVLATYPLRPEGAPAGTAPSKRGAHYPSTLPIFRPWLDDKAFEIQE